VRKSFILLSAAVALCATVVVAGPETAQAARARDYYVSLGDSYSVGYQPGLGSTPGYTVYVARHTGLQLVNFGCGGATTTSILTGIGCPDVFSNTVGGRTYPTTTQIAAADAFLHAHRGHIGLITVTIGGNDVTACARSADPVGCVGTAVKNITTNVSKLAADLRAAAGRKVPIIGSTYPDVILGAYVFPTHPSPASSQNLANLSVVAFKTLINPALKKAYALTGGGFVDVTKATGAYGSLKTTVQDPTYGTIPAPVAKVCALTWFCAEGNIHAKTPGYTLIGKLIVARDHAMTKR
jgi:lysophospholipase L1-like esterase